MPANGPLPASTAHTRKSAPAATSSRNATPRRATRDDGLASTPPIPYRRPYASGIVDPAPTGPATNRRRSRPVITGGYGGWKTPTTSHEVSEAMRAVERTPGLQAPRVPLDPAPGGAGAGRGRRAPGQALDADDRPCEAGTAAAGIDIATAGLSSRRNPVTTLEGQAPRPYISGHRKAPAVFGRPANFHGKRFPPGRGLDCEAG